MFGAVLTVAYSVMLAYVVWRAASVPAIARTLSRTGILAAAALLWLPFTISRLFGRAIPGPLAAALETTGMVLLGSIFLVASTLLLVDLVTLFGTAFRKRAPTLRGLGLLGGLLLSGFALFQGLRAPAVSVHEVTLAGLPAALDGKVLVAVSDAHLGGRIGARWFDARLAEIGAMRPDLVVFLGDMFEGHGDAPRDLPSLRLLSAPLGKWYVDGNHESHPGEGNGNGVLERGGFRRLADAWAEAAPGLILAGVNDLTRHRREALDGDPIGRALANRPAGAAVLLSHSPLQAERAARAGAGLMLSGHTHGGQIWPFGYLVRRVYPLVAGRFEVEGMTVIVCRGTGYWGPPMRLWRRGEILKVTLRAPRRPTATPPAPARPGA